MSEPVANTTPAAPAAAASPNATSAQAQSVTVEPMVALSKADFEALKGSVHRANRVADEANARVEKLQGQTAPQVASKPAGVEEQLAALQKRLDESEANAARDRLSAALTKAAQENGVSADRMDYLAFKLQQKHGKDLSDKGVPDATAPGALITVNTLVSSLLASAEGAVFKSAPAVASLPNAKNTSPASVAGKTMKLSEWNAMAKAGGEAYKQAFASVKAKEITLVDD